MAQGIFSTYSQGENRVTSTIIQVLKNLPVNVVERFLIMFSETDTQNFFRFENQVRGPDSTPDAEISANFRLLFETKTVPNNVDEDQLNKHLKITKQENTILVYLTPDPTKPKLLEDKQVVWKNFHDLSNLIKELLDDQTLILSERDQFLLKNLQDFFSESKLLPIKDAVVIVAASTAWPDYQKHGVYVCQAGRSFRNVGLIGFYAEGKIQVSIPKIYDRDENFKFPEDLLKCNKMLKAKLENWLKDNSRAEGKRFQVFDLLERGGVETFRLEEPIRNDLKNDSGRTYAFTQGQRYTSLSKLKKAKTTSDL